MRTYYDILGVSRDATLEEITTAKNALAKIYHPDANVHKDIDTTALMQEILEAYRVLSDPEKRKEYNRDTFGETTRVFRTFKVGPEDGEEEETTSFVTYWNTASQLHDILKRSLRLMEREAQKKSLPQRIFKKIGKAQKKEETFRGRQIAELSMQAVQYIAILKMSGIPMEYWNPDARGVITGLTLGVSAAHIARAALEGIAFQTMDVVAAMERDAGILISELKVDGGASRNNLMMQFQADVLGTEVICSSLSEVTALGAAYMAGLGVGIWKSIGELKDHWESGRRFSRRASERRMNEARAAWAAAVKKALA